MTRQPHTLAALQTPPGKGGIAVIALGGPQAARILAEIFKPLRSHGVRGAGVLRLGRLIDADGRCIDEAVVCETDGGIEINIHGGPAAARAALELLSARGAKIVQRTDADPFPPAHPRHDNPAVGREMLDALPAARGLLVVAALTQQWSAGLSELAREAIESPGAESPARLRDAAAGLAVMRRLLNPPEVVIAGPPNAGKSLLANALVGRQVSIVHEQAGTTRDWVREPALIDGVPIWLTDTAGLWEAPDPIDAEAVRRARHRAEEADLVLLLAAGERIVVPPWLHARCVLRVAGKCDVCPAAAGADIVLSAATGQGVGELRGRMLEALGLDRIDPSRPMAFTERQAALLGAAADAIELGDRTRAAAKVNSLLRD